MTDRLHWKQFFSVHRPVQVRRWGSRSDHDAHDHDFYELVLITGGSGAHLSAEGRRTVRRGDAILLTPGTWHEYSGCSGLSGYDCCFGKEALWRELAWLTDDELLARLLLRQPSTTRRRQPVAARLDAASLALVEPPLAVAAASVDSAGPGAQQQLFGTLLLLLGRFLAALPPEQAPAAGPDPAQQALVRRTVAAIEDDLVREWTLAGLAAAAATTPGRLSRAFRAILGRAPMTHLRRCRMERAAMQLLRSERAVADIAAEVGILDANYFARCFRAEMGLQPSAYRRRFQAGGDVPC